MILRLSVTLYVFASFTAGVALLAVASSGVEYAGSAALLGGAVAGVYGLLRKLASDTTVSHSYQDLIKGLQRDNEQLRARLSECEKRQGLDLAHGPSEN